MIFNDLWDSGSSSVDNHTTGNNGWGGFIVVSVILIGTILALHFIWGVF